MAFSKDEMLALLQKAWAQDRLAHAYLISGGAEQSRSMVAQEFTSLILGEHFLGLMHHPDCYQVEPDSKARKIVTEQIRSLEGKLHLTSQQGNYQVVMIYDAERMVPAAANAFLKTLEEPPDRTLLLLLTSLPEAILPTIRSRTISLVLKQEKEIHASNPVEDRLHSLLDHVFSSKDGEKKSYALADAFGVAHGIQELLTTLRSQALEEAEAQFALEKKEYAQRTDGSWESGRHQQLKVAAEATAIQQRSSLLSQIEHFFGKQLREIALSGQEEKKRHLQQRIFLEILEAVDKMQSHLEAGVQEQLVLETGFLKIISLLNE